MVKFGVSFINILINLNSWKGKPTSEIGLIKNAPIEAIEAYEEYKKWEKENSDNE